MITCAQDLHDLHRERHHNEFASFFFRHRKAQVQFTAADDHVFYDVVDGVMVDAGSKSHDDTDLGAIVPKELSRARSGPPARILLDDPV